MRRLTRDGSGLWRRRRSRRCSRACPSCRRRRRTRPARSRWSRSAQSQRVGCLSGPGRRGLGLGAHDDDDPDFVAHLALEEHLDKIALHPGREPIQPSTHTPGGTRSVVRGPLPPPLKKGGGALGGVEGDDCDAGVLDGDVELLVAAGDGHFLLSGAPSSSEGVWQRATSTTCACTRWLVLAARRLRCN